MRKNLTVAIVAGLGLAFGLVSNASTDGYEYYVPPVVHKGVSRSMLKS